MVSGEQQHNHLDVAVLVVAVNCLTRSASESNSRKLQNSRGKLKKFATKLKFNKVHFAVFFNISNQIKHDHSIGEVDVAEGIYVSHL